MNGVFLCRVEINGWQTELVTPLPIYGLEENVIYPLEEWQDTAGSYTHLVFTMPDGERKKVVNHPYQLRVDAREQEEWRH